MGGRHWADNGRCAISGNSHHFFMLSDTQTDVWHHCSYDWQALLWLPFAQPSYRAEQLLPNVQPGGFANHLCSGNNH